MREQRVSVLRQPVRFVVRRPPITRRVRTELVHRLQEGWVVNVNVVQALRHVTPGIVSSLVCRLKVHPLSLDGGQSRHRRDDEAAPPITPQNHVDHTGDTSAKLLSVVFVLQPREQVLAQQLSHKVRLTYFCDLQRLPWRRHQGQGLFKRTRHVVLVVLQMSLHDLHGIRESEEVRPGRGVFHLDAAHHELLKQHVHDSLARETEEELLDLCNSHAHLREDVGNNVVPRVYHGAEVFKVYGTRMSTEDFLQPPDELVDPLQAKVPLLVLFLPCHGAVNEGRNDDVDEDEVEEHRESHENNITDDVGLLQTPRERAPLRSPRDGLVH
mmetsp:Transcript_5777/g.16381  ORF Transcript_5777/g.16381 Transcript_5777/m.16381 type:complete len:326 (-) Transcript_5777:41-1018(-)